MAQLTLTAVGRSHLGTGPKASFRHKTHTHIPGAVVRGAYAAAWIARHGEPIGSPRRSEFTDLFEGPTLFGPLYPQRPPNPPRPPTPLSLRIHKYPPKPDNCRITFWDEALPTTVVPAQCPHCGSPLRQAKPSDNPLSAGSGTVSAVFTRTHVAIDDDGVAADGKLFQREENNPAHSPCFTGRIEASDELLDILRSYSRLRVGGRLTTSGAMTAGLTDHPYRPPRPINDHHLVIRLSAPGIFVTDTGAAIARPDPADLTHRLGLPARVLRSWTRWSEVGGWHIASGLPKHIDRAVDAGSTYLIETDRPLTTEHLYRLKDGLGIRRHEGFGAVGGAEHDPADWTPEA